MAVDWLEWSDDAFARARAEDKPLVLDLAAAWCHGCRVMDRETYGDAEIAELLRRHYVPVRVDSDRRPDINERYNLGGWPTTAFLTPSGHVLGGATYLDRNQMKQMLVQLAAGWSAQRARIDEEIARRDEKIQQVLQKDLPGLSAVTMEIFRKTVRGIVATFDPLHGGFGQAPKFPLPTSLRVVLQAYQETEGADFAAVLVKTLDVLVDRAIFDNGQGGFFHYATNDLWTAPRFEKLTEDNALLIRLYLDAHTVTRADKYRAKAVHALDWAKTVLLDPDRGVFWGSQVADDDYYGASPAERALRAPPPPDRTVIAPATCAMASTFLRASEVLGDPAFAGTALHGLDWMLRDMVVDGRVAQYHDGRPRVPFLLRGAVGLATSCLDAYEHTGEARWRDAARSLLDGLPARFWSDVERGFLDREIGSPAQGELARPRRSLADNASAADAYARLARLGGEEEHRRWADRLLRAFPDFLDGYGHDTAEYALAADRLLRDPQDVGPGDLKAWLPRRRVVR
ncbi:MAG TPA: DUF255 domain-containing protein [Planctomycetota bacterium]|nr:DUF255 domain-containing protein [Planctomycetota bacterium]